jgi:hypothetical protein
MRGDVDTEQGKVFKGLTAQELSADLMARSRFAFDQSDASSFAGERDSSGTACDSTTQDEDFILLWNPIESRRCNGETPFRIRYLNYTGPMGVAWPMLQSSNGAV